MTLQPEGNKISGPKNPKNKPQKQNPKTKLQKQNPKKNYKKKGYHMILIKNAQYCGKKVDLLFSETANEALAFGIKQNKDEKYHKHEKNYGVNYGSNGGQIIALGENLESSMASELKKLSEAKSSNEIKIIDATGKILFPSLIDVHVHFRDPGLEWKEDIISGLSAAAHGGFSHVLCMANTSPVNDNASTTRYMIEKANIAHPNGPFVHPVAAATVGLKGEELAPLGELSKAGCIAVSNDGVPLYSTEILRRVMEYSSDLDMIFIDHCEDPYLARGAHMNEGELSAKLGVKGQPDIGEALQVSRDVLMSEFLDIPVHIAHVSCKRSLDEIKRAKERGVKVTAETCPHYLLLTENAIDGYNTNAKVNPPLRLESDMLAMREAVKSGLVDCLITDHAPHAAHEKEHPLDLVPNGISGLDTAISLLWSLVTNKILSQEDIIRTYTKNPAEIFKLPHNNFAKGDVADFFLFDPNTEWEVKKENMYSKSANTPWLGQTLKGRVCEHYLGGVKIV